MTHPLPLVIDAVLIDEQTTWTLDELSHVCRTDSALLVTFVEEGVLVPHGASPSEWRFDATLLHRARTATRLARDLEIDAAALALVLDLLDEIDALRARLVRG